MSATPHSVLVSTQIYERFVADHGAVRLPDGTRERFVDWVATWLDGQYLTGMTAGTDAGYADGYAAGEAAGQASGYAAGLAAGQAAGESAGILLGRAEQRISDAALCQANFISLLIGVYGYGLDLQVAVLANDPPA